MILNLEFYIPSQIVSPVRDCTQFRIQDGPSSPAADFYPVDSHTQQDFIHLEEQSREHIRPCQASPSLS